MTRKEPFFRRLNCPQSKAELKAAWLHWALNSLPALTAMGRATPYESIAMVVFMSLMSELSLGSPPEGSSKKPLLRKTWHQLYVGCAEVGPPSNHTMAPGLLGRSVAELREDPLLRDKIEVIQSEPSPFFTEGYVVRQIPPPCEKWNENKKIKLTVSQGKSVVDVTLVQGPKGYEPYKPDVHGLPALQNSMCMASKAKRKIHDLWLEVQGPDYIPEACSVVSFNKSSNINLKLVISRFEKTWTRHRMQTIKYQVLNQGSTIATFKTTSACGGYEYFYALPGWVRVSGGSCFRTFPKTVSIAPGRSLEDKLSLFVPKEAPLGSIRLQIIHWDNKEASSAFLLSAPVDVTVTE